MEYKYILKGEGFSCSWKRYNQREEKFAQVWSEMSPGFVLVREYRVTGEYNDVIQCYSHYYLDFAHKDTKTAIEIDGPYHDKPEQQLLDSHRDFVLEELGWSTLRFKTHEVDKDSGWCVLLVIEHILYFIERGIKWPRKLW
jgi:very-short-patch-repair endonuclease